MIKLRVLLSALAIATPLATSAALAAMPGQPAQPPVPGLTRAPAIKASEPFAVQTVVRGLNHPWSVQFLSGGRLLVTERAGRMRIVERDGTLSHPITGVPDVEAVSQGGLLGLELDPGFTRNGLVYFSYLERRQGGSGLTAARAKLMQGKEPRLENMQVIFRADAAAQPLNIGGRLLFLRDGTLLISVGDRFSERDKAQQLSSTLGKIVRIRADGSIPPDNPFVNRAGARPEIYSYGHRNPEGLAINPMTGEIWEQEHGAMGGDEINIVKPGRNYGWPTIGYGVNYDGSKIGVGTSKPGMEQPVYYWDPSIAPSGLAFYTGDLFPAWKGSLFNGALKYQRVIRLALSGNKVTGEEELLADRGQRIRDVAEGPDGALYVLTDETDGRIDKLVPAKNSRPVASR